METPQAFYLDGRGRSIAAGVPSAALRPSTIEASCRIIRRCLRRRIPLPLRSAGWPRGSRSALRKKKRSYEEIGSGSFTRVSPQRNGSAAGRRLRLRDLQGRLFDWPGSVLLDQTLSLFRIKTVSISQVVFSWQARVMQSRTILPGAFSVRRGMPITITV